MKIDKVKINGIRNPIGFYYDKVKCSWVVEDFKDTIQIAAKIEVSKDKNFINIIYSKEGKNLSSIGEEIEINLEPRTRYFFRITVEGNNGETATSDVCYFETGKIGEYWAADWIGPIKEHKFHPIIFKNFEINNKVKRANLYICGLGLYEAYLNGNKIGNEYLTPFFNDYFTELQYQTYDITNMISENNIIEISLGNGWYKGRFGLDNLNNNFGDCFAAIAELHFEYEDGSSKVIATDLDWSYKGSDIEDSGIYDGEVLNRLLWMDKENTVFKVEKINLSKSKLVERFSIPVIEKESIKPKEIIHTPSGETVIDMGQNFAGYVEFISELPYGTKITLEFGEVLQNGNFYNENYRTAKAQFIYISKGELEKVRPHFTYFGFRYVKITGWIGEVSLETFVGSVIYSDLDRTGFIETSNKKINRLFQNSIWSQKSNFVDMPTDCPQRDERLGWTGDAQVFAPTASYNMDTRAFYDKFLHDLRNEQMKLNGGIPNYIPNLGALGGACSVWGDAATFIPKVLLEYYGDQDAIRRYYPLMKDWVDYVTQIDKGNGEHNLYDTGIHFGDWLALDGITPQSFKGGTDDYFIASVYYYESSNILSKMAETLNNEEDTNKYRQLANKIKKAILNEYFSPTGRLTIDTQAAYIIALKFGIYIDKEKLVNGFKLRLEKDCYKIKCGFVGAPLLCSVLCENGMENLAYYFLFHEGFPSWLYCVNLGATTIWERWNSLLEDGTVSGTGMNSFNHYAYGAVVEFMYKHIAGIQPLENGFKKVKFEPKLNIKLHYMNCTYESVGGRYVSNWRINKDGTIEMHFEVPFNCTAIAILPEYDGDIIELGGGVYDISYKPIKDYRKIFNAESRLEELALDEQAMKIVNEKLPLASLMIKSKDKESLSKSLQQLFYMEFMGFKSKEVQDTIEALMKIEVY
ncbi:alpha-L-rhamnosidase [Clostridium sp. YIM B02506]|uniref:alpha-L-rhamnosidase n=1 Tax=Clostridium sp. YIM B02506 TaxID=2910680 RepID=UPI001EED64EB|nr:alpha-L-rhamnosidase [Clostridium sp. YIM B02506]